jgi:hypothetical protein
MSEGLISRNQPIRQSTERQSLVTLIGLGALLLIIELYTLGAHRHNRFYSVLFLLSISGIPFVFAVWWTFQRKKVSKKHSLAHSDRRRVVSIDPCATRSSPALKRYLSLHLGWTAPGSRHQSVFLFAG